MPQKYWIIVASKDHARRGVEGGFCMANHGKKAPLLRLQPGDGLLIYSPKITFAGKEACQAFTAVGRVGPGPVEQVDLGNGFTPYRRSLQRRARFGLLEDIEGRAEGIAHFQAAIQTRLGDFVADTTQPRMALALQAGRLRSPNWDCDHAPASGYHFAESADGHSPPPVFGRFEDLVAE